MTTKIRRLKLGVTLTVVLSLAIVLLAPSFSAAGVACETGTGGTPLSVSDFSAIPQSVVDDAARLATELFGDYQQECDAFASQLLATYLKAKDKDFIMVFNPGGWGWNLLETSPEWRSIFDGIKSELNSSGYTSLLLDYQRTTDSWRGCFGELVEMMTGYPSKAQDLALRVGFLTNHIPDLRVILAGESTGTIISDRAMNILRGNPQVYSIQTGPPFWHKSTVLDRTLVMTSNGVTPDSFSRGDFFTIVCVNLEALFGFSQAEDEAGRVLLYVGSPGHEYWWQYPGVYSQITSFLNKNFGIKWR